ncbi:putative HTH-type transcriptional regulator [compost metagenome]
MSQLAQHFPRRSALTVQLLTRFGLDHGLSVERCLAGTGLDWQLLADPGAEVEAEQELQLIRNLDAALGHIPGIGLQAGLRYRLPAFGIWGFAILSSPNLRSALQVGLRYVDLSYVFHTLYLEESDAEARLVFDDRFTPADVRTFALERECAAALSLMNELSGTTLPVLRASFRIPPPADLRPYEELLGITPAFNAEVNCLVLDSHTLDLPLPGGNPEAARQCEEQCKALLAKRQVRSGLAGRIRDRLLAQPGQFPDMEQLADELHLTSRTLRRRLDQEGTSFRLLQDEVRQVLAEELLAVAGLSLDEIAERLGYGDVSNFIHAFKRWKGVTPRRYRRA